MSGRTLCIISCQIFAVFSSSDLKSWFVATIEWKVEARVRGFLQQSFEARKRHLLHQLIARHKKPEQSFLQTVAIGEKAGSAHPYNHGLNHSTAAFPCSTPRSSLQIWAIRRNCDSLGTARVPDPGLTACVWLFEAGELQMSCIGGVSRHRRGRQGKHTLSSWDNEDIKI